ncbi:MAG TPA: UvrD-helicase domain-containing protein [Chitinophagales bacterium]|nr:UvrD-helicase domain-containing protein [Chitinophagales bacterium]
MDYLDELNPAQREAVQHTDGAAMIIAGPGSGKTRVLTYRIAYLMQQGVDPFNILALTFTNKAAREMRERIGKIVGGEARNLWMGTFHAIFARILRIEADKLGYPGNFTIYDTQDSRNVIKNIVTEKGLNDKMYKPGSVHYRISSAKNSLISPAQYMQDTALMTADESSGMPKVGELYAAYNRRCFQAGAMDFDDLLFNMHILLSKFPDILYKYQTKFRYILIDEYQDTNYAQYLITKQLADMFQNICVVGDDAQSIYSFRGANIRNILNFEKDYPDLRIFRLEQNYRSTRHIVDVANKVIMHNKLQLAKKIWTDNAEGERIQVIRALSDNDEGRIVADSIHVMRMRYHYKNNDFAILYRTNAQSRTFEEALRRLNIPYKIYGGLSFYQRKEIKDLLAYLKLTVNHHDEEAVRRIINYPLRGIGKTTLEKATVIASERSVPLWRVLERAGELNFGAATHKIQEFITMIRSFAALLEKKNAYDLALHIARSTGMMKELYNDQTPEGVSRYENLQELLNSIKEFTEQDELAGENVPEPDKSLGTYLQQVTLLTDQDEDKGNSDTVKLMTIHSAKGLEFECVYVGGLEENLFPNALSLDTREDLEEERRLFYVAVTRAKSHLTLTYARSRYRYGSLAYCEPSRFLDELPAQHVEHIGSKLEDHPANNFYFERNSRHFPKEQPAPSQKLTFTKADYTPSENFKPDNPAQLQTGMEVEHQKFGIGKIISLEGKEDNRIATIFFPGIGQKRIMLKFAKVMILKREGVE